MTIRVEDDVPSKRQINAAIKRLRFFLRPNMTVFVLGDNGLGEVKRDVALLLRAYSKEDYGV